MERERIVLIVDDEKGIRDMLAQALTRLVPGCRPITAATGADALRILEEVKADVVLSDHRMPGMSGLDLLIAVRQHHARTHRILMTAFADVPLAERSVNEAHIEHFLQKPFRAADAAMLVKRLLAMNASEAENAQALARAFHERREHHSIGIRDVAGRD